MRSETVFLFKFFLEILLLPIRAVQALVTGNAKPLFQPLRELSSFLFEAKYILFMIIVNVVVYILSAFLSENTLEVFVTYPTDLWSPGRYYSFITAGFFHAGIAHLLGNMLFLFVFGRIVERKFGNGKTAALYFGALVLSGVFSAAINLYAGNNIGGIGASGAIMGLVAAAILIDPFYFTYALVIPLPAMIIGWLAIYMDIQGILNPLEDSIGHFAHLGGFLSVTVIMYLIGEKEKLRKGFLINLASFFVFLLYKTAFI